MNTKLPTLKTVVSRLIKGVHLKAAQCDVNMPVYVMSINDKEAKIFLVHDGIEASAIIPSSHNTLFCIELRLMDLRKSNRRLYEAKAAFHGKTENFELATDKFKVHNKRNNA